MESLHRLNSDIMFRSKKVVDIVSEGVSVAKSLSTVCSAGDVRVR